MLRVAPILLAMNLMALSDPVPPAKPVPAFAKTDLVGTWHLDMALGETIVKGRTEYGADGTMRGNATIVLEDDTIELTLKGTWEIDGTTLITTITESNNPELMPVGDVSKDEILELTPSTLRYRDENGLVIRETRDDPRANPPAKVVGKPVPPDEVKAINAAIEEMRRCFREADYNGMAKGIHPSLIEHLGGEEKFREIMENTVMMIESAEIKINDEQCDAPTQLHEAGDEWVCFVPKRNITEVDGRTVRSQGFYVAVRKKSGKEWKLIEGAGFRKNPELLWKLLPNLPRGVEIPVVKHEVAGED